MGASQTASAAGRNGKATLPADNRAMLNGMLWIARSGAQWRELPEAYGPWQSVYDPIRQVAGRRHTGNRISRAVRGCGYGKSEHGLHLRQGTRKR